MKVAMHPNASIQPPFFWLGKSWWLQCYWCRIYPIVDLPSTVVKSGPPSIATTVVGRPHDWRQRWQYCSQDISSAIATGVRSAGTSNGPHRLSPLTKWRNRTDSWEWLQLGFIKPKCFSPHCSMRRVSWHAIVGNRLSFNPVATTHLSSIEARNTNVAKVTQYH